MSLCSFALTIDRNLVCTTEVADAAAKFSHVLWLNVFQAG